MGKYATGLILEGYAAKGFHNKARSCNWGSMDCFGLQSVEEMREVISLVLGRNYAPVFNPGWMKQLVFHSNKTIANQIHAELLAATAHRR